MKTNRKPRPVEVTIYVLRVFDWLGHPVRELDGLIDYSPKDAESSIRMIKEDYPSYHAYYEEQTVIEYV